jgi:hypothetical protein
VEELASEFVSIRRAIARDPQASASDRLRAMEQLESRALGRPTEHVEQTVRRPSALEDIERMSEDELDRFLTDTLPHD